MTEIENALSEGTSLLSKLAPLLSVPALVSLTNFGEIASVLSFRGAHFGIEFPFPVPVGDLWAFVNTPDIGGGVGVSAFGFGEVSSPALALLFALTYFLIYALLSAGYVGSIQQYRVEGRYDFITNATSYARQYMVVTAVIFGAVLVMIPFALLSPIFIVLIALAVLLIAYLFWGAWFLIPIHDTGAIESLAWSYDLATGESEYLVWTLTHLVLGALLSVLATAIVVGTSGVGILIGVLLVIPVGFIFTVASLHIIDDLTGGTSQKPGNEFGTRDEFDTSGEFDQLDRRQSDW